MSRTAFSVDSLFAMDPFSSRSQKPSLPMHPEPCAVWNHAEKDASWDRISYRELMLFFDDEVLFGYIWYTIEDVPVSNSAPQWLRGAMERP
jgi:hypothetical protein